MSGSNYNCTMDDHTFDRRAATDWIEVVEGDNARVREGDIFPLLNAWINEIAPGDILDVGLGQGIRSIKIELNPCNYVGVEPSSFLVDRAKTRGDSVDDLVATIFRLCVVNLGSCGPSPILS